MLGIHVTASKNFIHSFFILKGNIPYQEIYQNTPTHIQPDIYLYKQTQLLLANLAFIEQTKNSLGLHNICHKTHLHLTGCILQYAKPGEQSMDCMQPQGSSPMTQTAPHTSRNVHLPCIHTVLFPGLTALSAASNLFFPYIPTHLFYLLLASPLVFLSVMPL